MTYDSNATPLTAASVRTYFRHLVNRFFKILPIRESGEDSVATYMESLMAELKGFHGLLPSLQEDVDYIALLAILKYLIDYPECELHEVKREVFHAISICNKLQAKCIVGLNTGGDGV